MKSEKLRPLRMTAWLILALAAATLAFAVIFHYAWPGRGDWRLMYVALGAVALGLMGCAGLILSMVAGLQRLAEAPEPAARPEITAAAPPKPSLPEREPGAEALLLLSLLQEKGRLVDFVMEDIGGLSNEQVGAAARVVHQGCRDLVMEAFAPRPVSPMAEDSVLKLEAGYNAAEFRVVGKADPVAGIKGRVVHKGWKAGQVKLPRVHKPGKDGDGLIIVPAEVAV